MLKSNSILKRAALLCACLVLPLSVNAQSQERIISAGSSVTELMLALGADSELIAVDVTSQSPKPLPKVGYHRRLSAEGLLALGPTKLIGSDEMGPKATLDQLKSAGVDVQVVNTESTVQGLKTRIDQIAQILNKQDKAQAVKEDVTKQVAALATNQPKKGQEKKILFLLIHEGRPANVAGADTTPDAIIKLAGGINPAADKLTSYKPLSTEAMIEMQPDVILVSGRSFKSLGGADEIIKRMPLLAATPAGKNKQIITIDGRALLGGLGLKSLSEAQRLNGMIYQ